MRQWRKMAERARALYREKGARALLATVGGHVAVRLGLRVGKRGAYLRERARVDEAFDAARGTDTGGVQHLFGMTIAGGNAAHGGTHLAVDPGEFAEAVAALGIDVGKHAFVDLGSGKGRAVLLAAEQGFREVVGVEFARELHVVAERNVAAFGARRPDLAGRIRLVHGDATEVTLPPGPVVVFLFNPFDGVVCGAVARRVKGSGEAVKVLYMNPVQLGAWEEAGWKVTGGGKGWVVMEAGNAE